MEHHRLTTEDVVRLRCSVSHRSSDGTNGNVGVPFVVYLPSEDSFALHAYGCCMATGELPVLATLMRCERAERGFIKRVLDSTEPPDVASLAPDERAAYAARAREEERKRTAYATEQATALARRGEVMDVSKIDLEDLL